MRRILKITVKKTNIYFLILWGDYQTFFTNIPTRECHKLKMKFDKQDVTLINSQETLQTLKKTCFENLCRDIESYNFDKRSYGFWCSGRFKCSTQWSLIKRR